MGHIVMLPFLAVGHFNSFVTLANLILHHHPSHTITIATTPLNLPKLRSMLSPSTPIQLATLPFDPTAHGLPPHGECTNALPSHLLIRLLGASFTLQPAFEQLLSGIAGADGGSHQPVSVISDTFCAWSVNVTKKLGIFHAVLTTSGAQSTVATFSMWLHLPHLNSDSDEFELPEFPEIRVHRSQLNANIKAADGTDYCSVLYRSYIKSSLRSSCMLVNSVEEIETKGWSDSEPCASVLWFLASSLMAQSHGRQRLMTKWGRNEASRKRNGSSTGSISTHPVRFSTSPLVRSAPFLLLR